MAYRETGARFSIDRRYRYALWRVWDHDENLYNFLLLNPSFADEATNDPTIERCERRARRWGFGGLIVTNLFASARPIPPACTESLIRSGRRMTRRSWRPPRAATGLWKERFFSRAACSPPGRSRAQSRSRTALLPDPWRRGRGSPQRQPLPRNLGGNRRIGAASACIFR